VPCVVQGITPMRLTSEFGLCDEFTYGAMSLVFPFLPSIFFIQRTPINMTDKDGSCARAENMSRLIINV
jgi:hypothetical protein